MNYKFNYIEYIKNNIYGTCVNELYIPLYDNDDSEFVRYYLHFLVILDVNTDHINLLCLENGVNLVIEYYSTLNKEKKEEELHNGICVISDSFKEQISQNLKVGKLDKDIIFNRQSDELWTIYNDTREELLIKTFNGNL